MRCLGIRAAPTVVTFAVYDHSQKKILNVEEIRIAAAFDVPDKLKYLRNNLLDVLREYRIEKAGVRVTEPSAQQADTFRIQMEGVIQEAFASSDLAHYYVGHISNISSKIDIPRADFKKYIDGELDWDMENWSELSKVEREAVLCAIGACNA